MQTVNYVRKPIKGLETNSKSLYKKDDGGVNEVRETRTILFVAGIFGKRLTKILLMDFND